MVADDITYVVFGNNTCVNCADRKHQIQHFDTLRLSGHNIVDACSPFLTILTAPIRRTHTRIMLALRHNQVVLRRHEDFPRVSVVLHLRHIPDIFADFDGPESGQNAHNRHDNQHFRQ